MTNDKNNALTANLPTVVSEKRMPISASVITILNKSHKLSVVDKLLPVALCNSVISEIEASLSNLPSKESIPDCERVATQAKKLVGCYPAREVHDAETYAEAISSAFWQFPPDIGWQAIDIITSRLRFLPTRADLFQVMNELVAKRRGLAYRAKAMLLEHDRRSQEAKEAEARKEREPLSPELQAKLDALLGRVAKPVPADEADLDWQPAGKRYASVGADWTPIYNRSELPPDCETRINPETGQFEARR